MTMRVARILRKVNVVYGLCHVAFGPDHPPIIRYSCAAIIMAIGGAVAKFGGSIHILYLHFWADVVGYGIHGIGLIPIAESIIVIFAGRKEGELAWPPIDPE